MKSKFITLTLFPTKKTILVNPMNITHIWISDNHSVLELSSATILHVCESLNRIEVLLNDD